MKHRGKIVNGSFVPDNKRKFAIEMELLNNCRCSVEVSTSTASLRSESIDGFYFKHVVGEVAAECEGFRDCFNKMEVHEKLMMAVTGRYEQAKDNTLRMVRDSYSKLSYTQKVLYVKQAILFLEVEEGAFIGNHERFDCAFKPPEEGNI